MSVPVVSHDGNDDGIPRNGSTRKTALIPSGNDNDHSVLSGIVQGLRDAGLRTGVRV